jgi:hypothetical protein
LRSDVIQEADQEEDSILPVYGRVMPQPINFGAAGMLSDRVRNYVSDTVAGMLAERDRPAVLDEEEPQVAEATIRREEEVDHEKFDISAIFPKSKGMRTSIGKNHVDKRRTVGVFGDSPV